MAIEKGFYVDPPGAVSKMIVVRLEIDPTAIQLVVGTIQVGFAVEALLTSPGSPCIDGAWLPATSCRATPT